MDTQNAGDPLEDGSAAHPFDTIQEGLNSAASGDTIEVAAGLYKGPGNKDLDFQGRAVALVSTGGPASVFIDCEGSGRGVTFHSSETAEALLSGFTIANGFASSGGAVRIRGASPTLSNCVFQANLGLGKSGAVYIESSSTRVANCFFLTNIASVYVFGTGDGGGLYCADTSAASVTDCVFDGNWASQAGGGARGGRLSSCTFNNNIGQWGGGAYRSEASNCLFAANRADYGGGANWGALQDCTFQQNTAIQGGGGVADAVLSQSMVHGNLAHLGGGIFKGTTEQCQVYGNVATNGGGCYQGQATNCTITGNRAQYGGGVDGTFVRASTVSDNGADVHGGGASSAFLVDCLIEDNAAPEGGGAHESTLFGCSVSRNQAYPVYRYELYCGRSFRPIYSWGAHGGGVLGGLMEGGTLASNSAWWGGGAWHGDLHDVTVSANSAQNGGGAYEASAAECLFVGNTANWGGGANFGLYDRCTFASNNAENGGGAVDGELRSCLIAGNTAQNGGGTAYSLVRNCTVVSNHAWRGGGMYAGTSVNSIVYYNTALPLDTNDTANHLLVNFIRSCTSPDPGGAGNFTNAPGLLALDGAHVAGNSPCVDAGLDDPGWMAAATDFDGEPRIAGGAVDVGCDEHPSAGTTGLLSMTLWANASNAVVDAPLRFEGTIAPRADGYVWDFGDGQMNIANIRAYHAFNAPGSYTVKLAAWNTSGSSVVTLRVDAVNAFTSYVDAASPGPVPPYTSPATAATGVMDAVQATFAGGTVAIADGSYWDTHAIQIDKALLLRGLASPTSTVLHMLQGQPCVRVSESGVVIENLTVTGGGGEYGGGLLNAADTVVRHCVIISNAAAWGGGSAFGRIESSALIENSARWGGGAAYASLSNCTLRANTSGPAFVGQPAYGGGAYRCELNNCEVRNNNSSYGGGLFQSRAAHCLIESNQALYRAFYAGCYSYEFSAGEGGGAHGGALLDCAVVANLADRGGGGSYSTDTERCTFASNAASNYWSDGWGGGAVFGQHLNSVFVRNRAPVGGGLAEVTGIHCTVAFNWGGQAGGVAYARMVNSIVFSNTSADAFWINHMLSDFEYSCTTPDFGGPGNTTNAPLFADAAGRLAAGSAGIDAAGPLLAPIDRDGTPRPLDGDHNEAPAPDMGAYEFIHPLADTDGDGLTDTNELGQVGTDPLLPDSDGDTSSDGHEWAAHTDPWNADSIFRLEAIARAGPFDTITWRTVFGQPYWVQRNTNPPTGTWETVWAFPVYEFDEYPEGTETLLDLSSTNHPKAFYRILTE